MSDNLNNVFAASSSTDPSSIGIRVVPAMQGVDWLRTGWDYFQRSPVAWIATFILFLLVTVGLSMVPFVGVVNAVLIPVFLGGVMLGCQAVARGAELRLEHVLEAFRQNTGNLLLLGLLNLAFSFALALLIGGAVLFLVGASALTALSPDSLLGPALLVAILVVSVLSILLGVPLTMALWFAPALVAFHNLGPLDAMRLSFLGCLRNAVALIVYSLLLIPLVILAMIPLGLGLLVVAPVGWISIYAGYRDVFELREERDVLVVPPTPAVTL